MQRCIAYFLVYFAQTYILKWTFPLFTKDFILHTEGGCQSAHFMTSMLSFPRYSSLKTLMAVPLPNCFWINNLMELTTTMASQSFYCGHKFKQWKGPEAQCTRTSISQQYCCTSIRVFGELHLGKDSMEGGASYILHRAPALNKI